MPESGTVLVVEQGAAQVEPPVEREFTVAVRSQTRMALRRFRQHKLAVGSLVVFVLTLLFAFVGPVLWKWSWTERDKNYAHFSQGPTANHPFGTDNLGYDLLAQVMRGAQRSLEIGLFVAVVTTAIGTVFGLVSGYYGGRIDNLMMRIVDLWLTFPLLVVAIVLGQKAENSTTWNGWFGVAIVLAGLSWASIARVIRGVVLSLREREYVDAARALGAKPSRIMFKHLLPNVVGPVIVNATIYVSIAILLESALSFLGFGVQPPDSSLGLLISQNQTAVDTRPWLFYFPGAFIVIIALTINFIGDGLRDALDPQQTRVRA